jgi:glycosyltransferase involved in cell wall biosynthesis
MTIVPTIDNRPHNVNPALGTLRVVMATKNWSNVPGVCSVGLSVTAGNTMKVLRRAGVHAESWQLQDVPALYKRLEAHAHDKNPITHVITSAPSWLQPLHFIELAHLYPETEFVQNNHTGTAYLSIDKFGIKNIRATIDLERDLHNVRVSWNNPRGRDFSVNAFQGGDLLLPNLYDTDTFVPISPARVHPDPIKIGSFGASRPWKNLLSAAEGAVEIAERLGVGLEYYVNSGRDENQWGGKRMIESRRELFDGMANKKIVEVPWAPWPKFRRIVRTMDLLINPSFDETFCVVTADGIAEGVPSVCTGAMEWTPTNWHAEPWDPTDIMRVGMGLLHDPHTVSDARTMLQRFVTHGTHLWINYLLKNKPRV